MNVTLLTAHPDPSSFCGALAAAWRRGAEEQGATVHHFDATRLEFDPVLRGPHVEAQHDEPDLARVRAAVEASAHVTWLFPTWWVGLPAAMKGLVDRLLLPRWAYRYEGGALPRGLLAGRSARYVTTMDAPRPWYWLAQHDAHGGAFARGTLHYVGFKPIDETLIFSTRKLDEAARARWLGRLAQHGRDDVTAAREREARHRPGALLTPGR